MKLVFAVDAICVPMTGIGRYAPELASRLAAHTELESLRYFSLGKWIADPASLVLAERGAPAHRRHLADLRRWLATRPWSVDAYLRLSPLWYERKLRRFGDHVFHSPNYFIPPVAGPAVATVHDLSIYKYPQAHPAARRRYFDQEFPRSLARAQHLITDSEATRREVAEYFGWPEARISAVPLGVDPRFAPRSAAELQPQLDRYGLSAGQYALCVSTVEPRKMIDRLLAAYEGLPAGLRNRFPLVLVGGRGWLSRELHALIERGIGQGWVRYLGYVPEAELPLLYAGARAFCFLSIYEGFGLPVLEAMASGVPVLVSNRTSLPEVAGDAGLHVEPEDLDEIRIGLAQVLEDDAWRARARARGLERAGNLTWERCLAQTLDVYRKLGV